MNINIINSANDSITSSLEAIKGANLFLENYKNGNDYIGDVRFTMTELNNAIYHINKINEKSLMKSHFVI
jgi:hypothetical protein